MGDIKRKRKKFSKPKKLYDRIRIDEENVLIEKYGLKNKKEIWKAKSRVSTIHRRAKSLIPKPDEEKKKFFEKLVGLGFKVGGIEYVLALTEEDLLDRRLQTIVFKKKLANSLKQARQLIVHKYVLVDGDIVNIPSFMVGINLEDKISVKVRKQKIKKEEIKKIEEQKNGVENGKR